MVIPENLTLDPKGSPTLTKRSPDLDAVPKVTAFRTKVLFDESIAGSPWVVPDPGLFPGEYGELQFTHKLESPGVGPSTFAYIDIPEVTLLSLSPVKFSGPVKVTVKLLICETELLLKITHLTELLESVV
jgi:hypothetical protein